MKLFLSMCLLSQLAIMAHAQQDTQLLVNGSISFSGFGGPILEFSSVNRTLGVSIGGGGALLIDHQFFFGGYGTGLATEHRKATPTYQDLRLHFGHGGFWVGYIHAPAKLMHLGMHTKLGWGEISLSREDDNNGNIMIDQVFVFTPQVDAQLNVTRWLRINLGIGYRWVTGLGNEYYTHSDFDSPTGSIALLFGGFARKTE